MGFLIKVPLWVPDSFQFMFVTFQNQYPKVNNIICTLMALQLWSLVMAQMLCRNYAEICRWCNSNKFTVHTGKLKLWSCRRINNSVRPLLPVQLCGNTVLKYTYSTKFFDIIIDGRLLWRHQVYEMCRSYCYEIIVLKRKTKIPHVTFSIIIVGKLFSCHFCQNWRIESKNGQNNS